MAEKLVLTSYALVFVRWVVVKGQEPKSSVQRKNYLAGRGPSCIGMWLGPASAGQCRRLEVLPGLGVGPPPDA